MNYFYFYFGIIAFCSLIGFYRLKSLNKSSKIMLLLLSSTFISEITAYQVMRSVGNNLYIYHIFMPVEIVLLGYCYYQEIKEKWIIISTMLIVSFSIVNSFFFQSFDKEFCSYTFVLHCVSSTIYSIRYLKRMLDEQKNVSFLSYPLFWISIGFTLFNITNLFILGTHNAIAEKIPNINNIFRNVRIISNYLLYMLIGIGFLSRQESLAKRKNEFQRN